MEVNYKSFVYLASYALPHLEENNGSIGVVDSVVGNVTVYCSSAKLFHHQLQYDFSGSALNLFECFMKSQFKPYTLACIL